METDLVTYYILASPAMAIIIGLPIYLEWEDFKNFFKKPKLEKVE